MTNFWNRFIYACWAPVYDLFIGISPFVRARRMAIERLVLLPGNRLLIVGIGTGADLPLLPQGVDVVGIDLSWSMLQAAHPKSGDVPGKVQLAVADAAQLPFRAREFDRILLALIVSVVPDPRACLSEVARVTSQEGRIVVFDKFRRVERPGVLRRLADLITRVFGTDINRNLERIMAHSSLVISSRKPAAFGGTYEVVEIRHESCTCDEQPRSRVCAQVRAEAE